MFKFAFRLAAGLMICAGMIMPAARAQQFTTGQIFPTNAATLVPPTNGAQQITKTVPITPFTFTIGNQNFGATNCLGITGNLVLSNSVTGAITALCPLTFVWNGNTNAVYNPTATNNTDTVATLATNISLGIQFTVGTTNDANTNLQGSINRTQ